MYAPRDGGKASVAKGAERDNKEARSARAQGAIWKFRSRNCFGIFLRLASEQATKRMFHSRAVRRLEMETQTKTEEQKARRELTAYLRKLIRWKSNDVVKLSLLGPEDAGQVDRLDLTGVAELKRNANGAFEVKFVDKLRVLDMLRELMEERRDGALEDFLNGLGRETGGGEA